MSDKIRDIQMAAQAARDLAATSVKLAAFAFVKGFGVDVEAPIKKAVEAIGKLADGLVTASQEIAELRQTVATLKASVHR